MPDARSVSTDIRGKGSKRLSGDHAIALLAERQHGIVARRQLASLGLSPRSIEHRIERGQLHRVHRGVYAVGHRVLTRHGRWAAAVLACGPDAVLSHRSAGQLWGIVPLSSHAIEVTRASGWRAPGDGTVVVHRALLEEDEMKAIDGIPVTSLSRTLLDLAAVLTRRQLEQALNEAEVRGLRDRVSIFELLERHPRRHGTATLRALLASDTPRGVTDRELEERFVAFLDAYELPRPRLNAYLHLRGRHFKIDCLWMKERLAVELDGRAAHGTRQAFERDRERDRILLVEGWRSMRITWRQLHDDAPTLAPDLRRVLGVRSG